MSRQGYLHDNLAVLTRRHSIDVRIYEWISCCKFLMPHLSVRECCISWRAHHKLSDEDFPDDSLQKTFQRIQNEILEDSKTVNQKERKTKI